jgi:hypothetical protein
MSARTAVVVVFVQVSPLILPSLTSGQQVDGPIPHGARIRATVPAEESGDGLRYVGILTGWTEADLLLDARDPVIGEVTLDRDGLSLLEVSLGTKRHVLAGLAIGTGLGLLVAGIIYISEDCTTDDPYCPLVYPLFMVPGAVLGTIAGVIWTSEKWEEMPRPY